jgi:hypothetical protein
MQRALHAAVPILCCSSAKVSGACAHALIDALAELDDERGIDCGQQLVCLHGDCARSASSWDGERAEATVSSGRNHGLMLVPRRNEYM